jgi:hypothetical protein
MPRTYRQLTQRLRVQRPGRPDLVSERPREEGGARRFLDSDAAPTLVTFEDGELVDVAWLLRIGAIVEWATAEGGERGETGVE